MESTEPKPENDRLGARIRLGPGRPTERGERARLYVRWMPHLGAEAVALYELLRVLPEVGTDDTDLDELAELLRSEPGSVRRSLDLLQEHGFLTERAGFFEVAPYPPSGRKRAPGAERREAQTPPLAEVPEVEEESEEREALPERKVEVVRARGEGVSADDYFRYMGTLPAPHIIEFLNGYTGRDGVEPDVVREALKIASERDARRVGYVRSILERWVERGVKTKEDVRLFEQDRKLRLVERSGAFKGGAAALKDPGGLREVRDGAHRQPVAKGEEDYRWFFGE